MTTIAWDGKDMVADKYRSSHGMSLVTSKLYYVPACGGFPESVVATIGSEIEGRSIIGWMRKGSVIDDFPVRYDDENSSYVVRYFQEPVDGHHIYVYCNAPVPFAHHMEFGAWGSGAELATMAMHLGCDAVTAIQHTSIYSPTTSHATESSNALFVANQAATKNKKAVKTPRLINKTTKKESLK